MTLPDVFLENMEDVFRRSGMTAEWSDFLNGFDLPWQRAWRVQKDRISAEEAAGWLAEAEGEAADFLRPVPWSNDGFYLPADARPGLSTAYRLGLLYIQEASAMLPAEVLAARPGERVLDLCAAPGGKSSQTATRLQGQGVLVANDISEARARILQRNLEQQGLRNSVVTHADPVRNFPTEWRAYFDAVQLDAPCSGEGMFRRDPSAIESWTTYGPRSIRPVQDELLDIAADLTRPGGRLVYSTCTFNLYENEMAISEFLARRPDYHIEDPRTYLPSVRGLRPGLVVDDIHPDLAKAVRIWPQDGLGEGHFCVLLRRSGEDQGLRFETLRKPEAVPSEARLALDRFIEEHLQNFTYKPAQLRVNRDFLYLLPEETPVLDGVHVLKSGTFVGKLRKERSGLTIEPSHSFLLELNTDQLKNLLVWERGDPRIEALFSGQTILLTDAEQTALGKGLMAISVENWPLSWGKRNGSTVKNLYPAGWVR